MAYSLHLLLLGSSEYADRESPFRRGRMAVPTAEHDEWYEALFDGDCKRVMDCLKRDRSLLEVGWRREPSRAIRRHDASGWRTLSSWKGRNALHVAAWRGCVELVELVLERSNLTAIKSFSRVDKQGAVAESESIAARTLGHSDLGEKKGGERNDRIVGGGDNLYHSLQNFRELLLAKDGYFGLEPLPMAALHFNVDVMVLLAYAYGECGIYPRPIETAPPPRRLVDVEESVHRDNRVLLRQATEKVIASFDDRLAWCLDPYHKQPDFNFLRPHEYLFHFLCSCGRTEPNVLDALWKEVRSCPGELWRFLLELHDGQGRTPANVALDSGSLERFLLTLSDGDDPRNVLHCATTALDGASRTLAHRAAATGALANGLALLVKFSRGFREVSTTCYATSKFSVAAAAFRSRKPSKEFNAYLTLATSIMERYTRDNGFRLQRSPKPLHAAILTKNYDCAKVLMESLAFPWSDVPYYEAVFEDGIMIELDTKKFACLAGADVELINSIKAQNVATLKGSLKRVLGKEFPTLHIVASSGNYELLALLIDDPQCNPFVEDVEGNTALHHALGAREFKFRPYFLDYVSCQHFQECPLRAEMKRQENLPLDDQKTWELPLEDKKTWDENRIVERQGCINLLLQAGCDVFKVNKKKQVPYPKGSLSRNAKFRSWWYEKQEKEFASIQNNLNFAANAISVTAALVATTSYIGPLQPPMGYIVDPTSTSNQIQDQNSWVLSFIVCDTFSFYLAIAAITFSLIPSLPMPQQSMAGELLRTRRMVTLAVAILFPAIIFVFLAFASSSFAVKSASITSSTGGSLMIATATVGGLICLGGFSMFFMRLLAFCFPRNTRVRYFYDHSPI